MKYIVIGLLLSIGWHIAKVVYEMAVELLFSRLHDAKWYRIIAGKESRTSNKSNDPKTVKNQIGFCYKEN